MPMHNISTDGFGREFGFLSKGEKAAKGVRSMGVCQVDGHSIGGRISVGQVCLHGEGTGVLTS
jgi:hypothetical protein